MDGERLLTVAEVAKRLCVAPGLIYALAAQGRLPSYRIGRGRGLLRFSDSAVREYLAASAAPGPSEPAKPVRTASVALKHLKI